MTPTSTREHIKLVLFWRRAQPKLGAVMHDDMEWKEEQGDWESMQQKHGPLGFSRQVGMSMTLPVRVVYRRPKKGTKGSKAWKRWVVIAESAVMRRARRKGLGMYAWEDLKGGTKVGRYGGTLVGNEVDEVDCEARRSEADKLSTDTRIWVSRPSKAGRARVQRLRCRVQTNVPPIVRDLLIARSPCPFVARARRSNRWRAIPSIRQRPSRGGAG